MRIIVKYISRSINESSSSFGKKKNILAPLGTTSAASVIDAGIQKKIQGLGATILIISNEEINDLIKIVQALEDSNILLKGVTKRMKNKTKKQKGGFKSM